MKTSVCGAGGGCAVRAAVDNSSTHTDVFIDSPQYSVSLPKTSAAPAVPWDPQSRARPGHPPAAAEWHLLLPYGELSAPGKPARPLPSKPLPRRPNPTG